ncbi:MAG: GNAT family N-acetyltransferase [Candidatus Sulfotelmatobacter sp.]
MAVATANLAADFTLPSLVMSSRRGGLEVVAQLEDEWRCLCDDVENDQPFYRPEWIRAYLRAFVPEAKVQLVTARLSGRLCLVLPMVEERGTFSGIPVWKLRAPVNSAAGRFDAMRNASVDGDTLIRATWEHLKEIDGWDLLQFRDAPEGSTVSCLAQEARADGYRIIVEPENPSPYVAVSSDPDLLEKMPINSRLRRELRQVRRQLSEQRLDFYRVDTADRNALERFYQLEASGWKGQEGSAIICDRKNRQFFDEIAESAARFGYFSLYMLELNGRLMAAHFGFTLRSCYYSAVVAYDEEFKQFSPGHLIISEIVRDCAARGLCGYDPTGQNQEWKMKWTNEVRPMNHYYIFRGALGNAAYAAESKLKPVVSRLLAGKNKSRPEFKKD